MKKCKFVITYEDYVTELVGEDNPSINGDYMVILSSGSSILINLAKVVQLETTFVCGDE